MRRATISKLPEGSVIHAGGGNDADPYLLAAGAPTGTRGGEPVERAF
jgi:hypothetical protein